MGTEKRERQKANRRAKQQTVEAVEVRENRERNTKRFGTIAAVIAAIVVLALLLSWCGGSEESGTDFSQPVETTDENEVAEVAPLASSVPSDFEPWAGEGALAGVQPAARNDAYDSAPPMLIDVDKQYSAAINTTAGTIRLNLFPSEAPVTVNNFVALARDGFYDGVAFHRVLEGFMAQGGDPTGRGSGGPGYSFEDEFASGRGFDKPGLLAMANSGPATNGSQFFITFVETPHLNGLHTIFGELTGDAAILDEIVRTDAGPATVINSVGIIEG